MKERATEPDAASKARGEFVNLVHQVPRDDLQRTVIDRREANAYFPRDLRDLYHQFPVQISRGKRTAAVPFTAQTEGWWGLKPVDEVEL